ncbi:MAG: hypothetical protein V2A54_04310 [Bacteroidota bacterium]
MKKNLHLPVLIALAFPIAILLSCNDSTKKAQQPPKLYPLKDFF